MSYVKARMRAPSAISGSFLATAASTAPDETPISSPSSRAARSVSLNASGAATSMTPFTAERWKLSGTKLAPMPWIGWPAGCPPLRIGEASGSTAKTFSSGQRGRRTSPTAVTWPPVPTPAKM